jgi:polyhydroxyalkanoate synthase
VLAPRRILSRLLEQQGSILIEQRRAWRRLLSTPGVVRAAFGTRVGNTPRDVVFREGTLSLLRYRRRTPATHAEPVLFCYALVNRPYILDLQPGKSVVERYLERGFDVYLIDWGVPSHDDRALTLEDYVSRRLARVIDFILREHGREHLHLLGYCMGGTLSALYTAVQPCKVKTLTLLAAPIDFAGKEALLHVWTNRGSFDVDTLIDVHGNCPAEFLQMCFLAMRPVQNLLEKNISLLENLEDGRFLSSYFAMETWVNDNIPVAGATFREFVHKLYQNNELVRGEFELGRQRIDLQQIRCPLLLLTADKDHLVVPASTRGIRRCVGSREVDELRIDAGHVGLVVSSKAHKTLWPAATRWLAERSSASASSSPTLS